ncbi:DSBA oxidoreductase [Neoasaia chiangmaiensis NBRC 101099]|uniref:2-hydroxychromene-2-carboxylate isomerase n=1 Tax=Neoasaia chiangmaiensis TaxID=320497 RepID=A0A1U9KTT8_9PROT|nr:DsbA family protein [Neoasaia chiangmaiensis]AQS89137.1 hypothetical protein A0U93_15775 [Neoasaia chiangmaiensis]GBR37099.1 DSBA oxidoreductase [Neoasaia chiangmaiensis NBRC 101099]GEN16512.1 2-hydroxychromene-2-carboxylate isomerase [Neoasaia chiangmaiensis]
MQVEFVYDYRSIYAYLANTQVRTLGADIVFLAVDIVSIMEKVNNQPSPRCPPKARYARVDSERWARLYGVPLAPNEALLSAMRDGHLPNALLSRAALAARRLEIFEPVNNALFAAVWAGSDDLATEKGRLLFCEKHRFPASLWHIADSDDIVAELTANNARALAAGVFGVPTFFVGGEMFFGNDRLGFVRDKVAASQAGDKS